MALIAALATAEVAPVAYFHGWTSSCEYDANWPVAISKAIDGAAVVKCVEVGDGVSTSWRTSMDH